MHQEEEFFLIIGTGMSHESSQKETQKFH